MYFKVYRSEIPVIERAIKTAAQMLGSDKSCGYCLEMICAACLDGANIDGSRPGTIAVGGPKGIGRCIIAIFCGIWYFYWYGAQDR
jgi:hypothetical protein